MGVGCSEKQMVDERDIKWWEGLLAERSGCNNDTLYFPCVKI